jgi:hypothetical protein
MVILIFKGSKGENLEAFKGNIREFLFVLGLE